MRRVLFRVGGFTVYSYPAMLYVGTVAGVFYGHAAAERTGLDPFRVWLATLLLFVVALLGSRLLFVATHWPQYRRNPARIFSRVDGGAAQYGGLLAAVPVSWLVLRALDLPFGAFWDLGVLTILVAMIFTRIGCFLNGCCSGRQATSFGLNLPNHRGVWQRRIPTQLLEGAFAAVLLASATRLWPSLPFPGALFLLVTGSYATGRLALESAREHEAGQGPFTIQHVISALIMAVSFVALAALSA